MWSLECAFCTAGFVPQVYRRVWHFEVSLIFAWIWWQVYNKCRLRWAQDFVCPLQAYNSQGWTTEHNRVTSDEESCGVRPPDFFRKLMLSCFLCILNLSAQHDCWKTLKTELLKLFNSFFKTGKSKPVPLRSWMERESLTDSQAWALGKWAWRAGGGGWSLPQQSSSCGSAALQMNPAPQSSLSWCCCLSKVHKGTSVTHKCLFMGLQVSIAFGLVSCASKCVQDFCWVNNALIKEGLKVSCLGLEEFAILWNRER